MTGPLGMMMTRRISGSFTSFYTGILYLRFAARNKIIFPMPMCFTVFLDMACARVTDQVIPTLLEQFELHKQV